MGQVKRWLMELEYAFNDDGDEFTSHLLRLIRRAGPQDKARLRRVYPQEVAAYEMWQLRQEKEWLRQYRKRGKHERK